MLRRLVLSCAQAVQRQGPCECPWHRPAHLDRLQLRQAYLKAMDDLITVSVPAAPRGVHVDPTSSTRCSPPGVESLLAESLRTTNKARRYS